MMLGMKKVMPEEFGVEIDRKNGSHLTSIFCLPQSSLRGH